MSEEARELLRAIELEEQARNYSTEIEDMIAKEADARR